MVRLLGILAMVIGLLVVGVAPVVAGAAWSDQIDDIDTVLAVRRGADFPIESLMRATCDDVRFVQAANGAGVETMRCRLSSEPVMIPAFQGTAPSIGVSVRIGPCEWTSDYWFERDGSIVLAESVHYSITPQGQVNVTAHYAAEPTSCS